jgi:hypothetical protein
MDENREIRAMLFSCLHLPPLPVIMMQAERDEDRVRGECVESSHALIGNLIEWVRQANNQDANDARMQRQMAAFSRFQSNLLALDLAACSDESLYEFYCHHTRQWLDCYAKVGHTACFKPLEYVTSNDKLHRNAADYCKAQYHHFTEGKESLTLEATVPYRTMLRRCAEWTQTSYKSPETAERDESE